MASSVEPFQYWKLFVFVAFRFRDQLPHKLKLLRHNVGKFSPAALARVRGVCNTPANPRNGISDIAYRRCEARDRSLLGPCFGLHLGKAHALSFRLSDKAGNLGAKLGREYRAPH